jgi:hypothetical protein
VLCRLVGTAVVSFECALSSVDCWFLVFGFLGANRAVAKVKTRALWIYIMDRKLVSVKTKSK